MANTKLDYLIPVGILKKTRKFVLGHYSLKKIMSEVFNWMNVPFADPCCSGLADSVPVRYNETTGGIERYSDGAWVATDDTVVALATGLTAHAGGGQGSAIQLAAGFSEVTTAATAGDSVKLPAAEAGKIVVIKNDGASAIDVFPTTGDTINDGSANAAISVGTGVTVVFTAINGTNWETNNQKIEALSSVATGASGVISGTLVAGFFPTAAQQALSGAGAINLTSYHTALTTTGANALTLANGTVVGQRKKITMVVDGGDGTLTPTSLSGGTTVTFNDAGDFVELIWNGTAWVVIQNSGTTIA